MSEFLPESGAGTAPQTDSVGSLLTPATLDISSGDIALMQKVLAAAARNPNLIPSDFMAYVVDYIQTSRIQIPIGQVFGYTKNQVVAGRVTSAGAVSQGTGFASSRSGVGLYAVTFDVPFATPPVVIVQPDDVASGGIDPVAAVTGGTTVSSFSVRVFATTTNGAVDEPWLFLAQPAS